MTDDTLFGSIQMQSKIDAKASAIRIPDGQKARIGLVANFRGSTVSDDELGSDQHEIDIDSFVDVFCKLNVAWTGRVGSVASAITIEFDSLNDFDPDWLFKSLDIFSELRDLRQKLSDDDQFAEAAAIVESWNAKNSSSHGSSQDSQSAGHAERETLEWPSETLDWPPVEGASLLDQILDEPTEPRVEQPKSPVDKIIKEIVAPHITPAPDVRKPDLISRVDLEIRDVMRQIIHHPEFLDLESRWRAVEMLTRRIEADTHLSIYLVNASQTQVATDLTKSNELGESSLYKSLVDATIGMPGAVPWSLLISDFEFGNAKDDVSVLGRIAKVAAAAGSSWFMALTNQAAGFSADDSGNLKPDEDPEGQSDSGPWNLLQELPESKYLAAFWPKFMIRAPYGRDSKPVETFEFEECDLVPLHSQFPWACSTWLGGFFACRAICDSDLQSAVQQSLIYDRLPLYTYGPKKDRQIQHASECLLNDKQAREVTKLGINVLRPVRDSNTVFVEGLRSVNGDWLG